MENVFTEKEVQRLSEIFFNDATAEDGFDQEKFINKLIELEEKLDLKV